ncbi:hypothetical protein BDK51DRAFT_34574, partial [Blyttiomyces helicus]
PAPAIPSAPANNPAPANNLAHANNLASANNPASSAALQQAWEIVPSFAVVAFLEGTTGSGPGLGEADGSRAGGFNQKEPADWPRFVIFEAFSKHRKAALCVLFANVCRLLQRQGLTTEDSQEAFSRKAVHVNNDQKTTLWAVIENLVVGAGANLDFAEEKPSVNTRDHPRPLPTAAPTNSAIEAVFDHINRVRGGVSDGDEVLLSIWISKLERFNGKKDFARACSRRRRAAASWWGSPMKTTSPRAGPKSGVVEGVEPKGLWEG